jgi:DNA polymerase III delta prime subunit
MAPTSEITCYDAFNFLYQVLKEWDFSLEATLDEDERGHDLFLVSFKDADNKEHRFVLFFKPLTPSSRNRDHELNYQVIDKQRDSILKLAKKHKALPLYFGWDTERHVLLAPSPDKLEKSKNQGSIYWSIDWLSENEKQLADKFAVDKINADGDFSHLIHEENLPHYLLLLSKLNKFDPETFEPKGVTFTAAEEIVLLSLEKSEPKSVPKSTPKSSKKESGPTANSLSVVFCGPPGTGKTRTAMILASELLSGNSPRGDLSKLQTETYPPDLTNEALFPNLYRTQFHPSLAYEDFLEGLRPVQVVQDGRHQDVTYRVIPGVFKVVCQLARAASEPGKFGIPLLVQFADGKWLINDGELALYRFKHREGVVRFRGKDVQLTGPVGAKTTFSPEEGAEPTTKGIYPVEWFAKESEVARKTFVLVIDELNRGNPSRIFGEALSLIEDSKRVGADESAQLILPYSHEEFGVPSNLHFICAMNLADKSLAVIDQAFRRRFKFVYLDAQFQLLEVGNYKSYLKEGVPTADDVHKEIIEHFGILNKALSGCGISSDQHIGHSYGFKLLGTFYRSSNGADKNAKSVARKMLMELWGDELHSLVRDILGEHRLVKFCDKIVEFSKESSDLHKLATAEKIKKFLLVPNPNANEFPWAA